MKVASTVWIVCACLALSGCNTIARLFSSDDDGSAFADSKAVYVEEGEPKIVSGLTLRVGVTASGAKAVESALMEVNANGEILMPLIGAVPCEGLTLVELQEKLKGAFKDYFIEPQVTVGFAYVENSTMKSPWGTVLLMGEVARPGPVNMPSTRDLTVTRALMLAGNVTRVADKSRVKVTRRQKDGELKHFTVDIEKIGKDGRADLDIRLKPGDVVWVPESWY